MNEISIRTNDGQYVGGQTVYGAVYLRIFRPVNADMVSLTFSGYETCEWHSSMITVADQKDKTGEGEIQSYEVRYCGRKELFTSSFNLMEFAEGAVPLGCYAFPFHYTLQQGLPSSLSRGIITDSDQNISYKAGIYYEVTAELQSPTISLTDLVTTCNFEVKNEDILNAFKVDEKPVKSVTQSVPSCFCFPRGDVNLQAQLDDVSYTIGDTISVEINIENSSSTPIKAGTVKLNQIIILYAYEARRKEEKPVGHVARVLNTVQDLPQVFEIGPKTSYSRIVEVVLPVLEKDSLPTTNGSIVKCRYHIEVSLKVPWGGEISLIIPITVFPKVDKGWQQWQSPIWLRDIEVKDASGICSVPRHLLDSREFMNVPLHAGTRL